MEYNLTHWTFLNDVQGNKTWSEPELNSTLSTEQQQTSNMSSHLFLSPSFAWTLHIFIRLQITVHVFGCQAFTAAKWGCLRNTLERSPLEARREPSLTFIFNKTNNTLKWREQSLAAVHACKWLEERDGRGRRRRERSVYFSNELLSSQFPLPAGSFYSSGCISCTQWI